MTSDIDPNAVAAGAAAELTKEFFKGTIQYLRGSTAQQWEKFFPKFEKHLEEVRKRSTNVKILCSPDTPVEFEKIYVCPELGFSGVTISENDLVSRIRDGNNTIVKSNGGTGKTFLMRNIWMRLVKQPRGKVPVLIELRGLNDPSILDLETYIRATAFKAGGIGAENFREFCKQGLFVFLFDGFDEVDRILRKDLESQILTLADAYLNCTFVVTGRPDDRFGSWTDFTIYSCKPFNYEQFRELITKVPFNEKTKRKFLKVSDLEFFEKHEDFLSNPLLALMMLITYRDNAEIPSKLSVFYENCFLALYNRHDALKEQYSREKKLDQDEFRRVFSVFCLFSYLKNLQQLEEADFRALLEKSINFSEVDITIDELIEELLETVNLIQKEGSQYSFIHRSFQEYFAAYCTVKVITEKRQEALQVFSERRMDSTLSLCNEMHPSLVSSSYLLPNHKKITEDGLAPTKFSDHEKYAALKACEHQISFHFITGSSLSRTTSWGPKKEYAEVQHAFDRLFLQGEFEKNLADITFDLHDIAGKEILKIGESRVKSGTEINLSFFFEVDSVEYNLEISREYKRLPRSIENFCQSMKDHTDSFAPLLEDLQRKKNRQMAEMASSLQEEADKKSNRLAEEFDL